MKRNHVLKYYLALGVLVLCNSLSSRLTCQAIGDLPLTEKKPELLISGICKH